MKMKSENGFSLIELLIVVGIVAILSSLAYFNYAQSAGKAKRTDGRSMLLQVAASLEKCKAVYGTYNNANCSITNGSSTDSPEGHYSISITSAATTFTLTATPQGAQASDTCTQMTLDNLQVQGGSPSVDECW